MLHNITTVFKTPHVLVSKGFASVGFADFDVSFQDFLRGIHGPPEDRDLLIFLAAYLRSPLAKYFLFHTSSNWGITRKQIHLDELQRLPFFLPDATPNPQRAWQIVREIARIVIETSTRADQYFTNREGLVTAATGLIEPLLDEYFDLLPIEKTLINDTIRIMIPSVRPTRNRRVVPTLQATRPEHRDEYTSRLCETLNDWSRSGPYRVRGHWVASERLGLGVVILQKTSTEESTFQEPEATGDLLNALGHLRSTASRKLNTFELYRGVKIFDRDRLFLVKPIGRRFWTQTAALNDADEIAGTLLMYVPQEVA